MAYINSNGAWGGGRGKLEVNHFLFTQGRRAITTIGEEKEEKEEKVEKEEEDT